MKLILVRHGESARNRGYRVLKPDNNITTEGVKQAIKLAKKLKKVKIEAIYCSPAPRCEQTMDEILRVRNGEINIHFTRLIGPKRKKENFEHLKTRIELFMDDLAYDHQDGETVMVISHRLPIEMITYLLGNRKKIGNGEMVEVKIASKMQ